MSNGKILRHLIRIRLKVLALSWFASFSGGKAQNTARKPSVRLFVKKSIEALPPADSPAKPRGKAFTVLIALLMVYLAALFLFLFAMLWNSLAVFCTMGLTWLYFAMAGLVTTGLTVFLNVFTTQTQLYTAKDNELLLSMPIPPGIILLSRMAVLLFTALGGVLMVMAPAVAVYLYRIGPLSPAQWIGIFASILAVTFTAQGLACILGYLLHLLFRRIHNKAAASVLYMVLFLGVYFFLYTKIGNILAYLAANGEAVAASVKAWAAPFYVLGLACEGKVFHTLLLITGAALLFGLIYLLLAKTLIRSMQHSTGSTARSRAKVKPVRFTKASPIRAVFRKELRRFLTSSIYLTNYGIGLIMILAGTVAVVVMRGKILGFMELYGGLSDYIPLLIPAAVCVLNGMACLTAPSISLEGKNLWIPRSMPISGKAVLLGKLTLHLALTGTLSTLSGLVVSIALGCTPLKVLLITLLSAAVAAVSGMLGLLYNLLLPNFVWINEAVPCKQGAAAGLAIFSDYGLALAGFLLYLAADAAGISPLLFLVLLTALLLIAVFLLYRLITTWGAKKFESF